ncbi:MAG: very short patch repair endonuclease [Gemmatimonadaceae bacterium]
MVDVHKPEQRSRNMAAIKGKNTKPELLVRRLLHSFGYRYTLHSNKLPGKPDLVFPARKKVIFVHGCFWHMHRCCYGRVVPATRTEFWQSKRRGNVARDRCNRRALKKRGYSVRIVWACKTRDAVKLFESLEAFLER